MSADLRPRVSTRTFTIAAIILCLAVAGVLSQWASNQPDGLEFVAGSTGFLSSAEASVTAGGPFADYGTAGVDLPWLSLAIAGVVGTGVTFGLAWLVGRASARQR